MEAHFDMKKMSARLLTWITVVALLILLLPGGAVASGEAQLLLQTENITVQEGQIYDLTGTPNADAILALEEGTIVIRYQSSSNQSYQSLFSVSNGTQGNQDRHFHLYVTPDGTLGMELRNTDSSFKYTMASGGALTTGVNTVAFSADADEGTYKLFANGALAATLEKDDYRFFADILGLDTISLGGTIRSGQVRYPFGGTILHAEVYNGPLADEELLSMTAAPVSLSMENIPIQSGTVYDLTEQSGADGILAMREGTILIRYTCTSSEAYQSLFSVSNGSGYSNRDRHFHLYVTSDGTLGMELRNTDQIFKYTLDQRRAVKTDYLSQPAVNTVALKADASAGVYKLFANGALVAQLHSDEFRFFSDITGANKISLGGTIRNGSVGYPFGGTIHSFQITSQLLSDEELCAATAETKYGTKVFHPGDATQANYFRIPSLLTLKNGTVAAAADARYGGTYDSKSNIDIAFSYSTDGGSTWSEPTLPLCFDDYAAQSIDWPTSLLGKLLRIGGSASFIDPLMVQDQESGRLFLFADAMPAGIGSSNASVGNGYKMIDGKQYLKLRWHEDGSNTYNYSVRENGVIYNDTTGQPTEYALNEDFEVLQNGTPLTVKQYEVSISGLILNETKTDVDVAMNVFYQDSLFKVYPTSYLAMVYSDNNGLTWSSMRLLNTLKSDSEKLLITGPGVGIQLQNGAYEGRLVVPVYSVTNAGFGVIYSDNGGDTWSYAAADTSSDGSTAEAQIVELPDGSIRAFIRTSNGYIVERTSIDGGCTWTAESVVSGVSAPSYGTQLSVINYSAQIDGQPVVLMSTPNSTSGRNTGVIRVGVVRDTGGEGAQRYAIDWEYTKTIDGTLDFSYSCLAELPDGTIGLFYENYDSWDMNELHTKDTLMLEFLDFQQLLETD